MFDKEQPLVSICCIAYNQEKFIRECLDSFLMQKTNFSFEIVISDDCSNDNTKKIINSYIIKFPNIFVDVSPSENLGMIKNYYHALSSCKGKYIAFCEGDDYWIDENKLQMQVDFLESNPEYGMCYTKAKQYDQKNKIFFENLSGADFISFYYLLKGGNPIPALTTVYKKELLSNYLLEISPIDKKWLMGDYPLWLYISRESKVMFMDKVTSVYRILTQSASHHTDINKMVDFRKSVYDIKEFYSKLYNVAVDFSWNETSYFIQLAFAYGKRNELLLFNKVVTNKADKIKILLAKNIIVFNISLFCYKVYTRFLVFLKKMRTK